jgi:hypothetical protein
MLSYRTFPPRYTDATPEDLIHELCADAKAPHSAFAMQCQPSSMWRG